MTNPEISKGNTERLDEASLLELLRNPGACLRAVEGGLEGSAWGKDVTVLTHPIPVKDLLFADTIVPHLEQADEAPKGQLKLHMLQGWRWGFDPSDPSFRISKRGQGEILAESGGTADFHFVTLD